MTPPTKPDDDDDSLAALGAEPAPTGPIAMALQGARDAYALLDDDGITPMTRGPRTDPQPGDRWRTEWGVSTVTALTADGGVIIDGGLMSRDDWLWSTARGRWAFIATSGSTP